MQKYSDVVLDKSGKPIQGATITVTTYPDALVATIYAADGGPAVASVVTDNAGRFAFYAANGHYTITVAGQGITPFTYNDVTLFDPNTLSAPTGSALVTFKQSGAGAVATTVQDELRSKIRPEQFGAKGDGIADDTAALSAAIIASISAGGFGTIHLGAGKRYNFTSLAIDGVIGLAIKGGNGGNVGNLAPNSSGGASMLVCTSTSGNAISFTGQAYHAAQITLEDVVIYANTPGYALTFDNVSQINISRAAITNAGGTAYNNGHGIRISNCYYAYFDRVYVWKTGTLYSVGSGVTIDMGAQTSFLGGLFNFTNCSLYGWAIGLAVGDQNSTPTANEGYANINYVNSELNSNGQGACFYYGTKTANVSGCYIEGNLQLGVGVYNKAANVCIEKNFFNNSTATAADIHLGLSGSGSSYPVFYNVAIRSNQILGVNKYGVQAYAGAGSSLDVSGNFVTLASTGAVGFNLGESVAGNLTATIERNNFYGFPAGSAIAGARTRGTDNYEYDAGGSLIAATKHAAVTYAAFADFTQIQPNDPETTVMTNTTAGARYINGTVATNKHRRQHITLTAASTQNVRLMKADSTTQLAVLTPGKAAIMWNDGTSEYATLLP